LKRKFLTNLSANTLQLIINQLCGFAIFYILSIQLSKDHFGQINLVLAIMLVAFSLITLGIDQVIIKKIAGKQNIEDLLTLYIGHVLLTGTTFYVLLFLCSSLLNLRDEFYPLLLVIGAGKLMIYFSTPFKVIASGMEKFRSLALMLIVSNVVRSSLLIILYFFYQITLRETIIAFVIGDLLELIVSIYIYKRNMDLSILAKWNKKKYFTLVNETLPQTGVVILTAFISRFDWIIIAAITSSLKLAEYSFAYKIFEISSLPLLAIAPLLLPWLTKVLSKPTIPIEKFKLLIRMELVIASLTALALNLFWQPVIDYLTSGKYGEINTKTIFILSCAIPFLYLNNFFWTIYFAQDKLKMILKGFMLMFMINASLVILLVPFFSNEGAATAFLISCIAQTFFYLKQNKIVELQHIWQYLGIHICSVLIIGFTFKAFIHSTSTVFILSFMSYIFLMFLLKQIKPDDFKTA
jgi:O-antigen/teichoic acid export membrane protein